MWRGILIFMLAFLLRGVPASAAEPLLIADFEGGSYAGWTITGTAFGSGPARGTLARQRAVTGYQGKGLVNSYFQGDASQGTLTSPAFPIARKYIHFLLGGGNHPGQTCLNLLLDDKIVCSATGADDEHLTWHTFDVAAWLGKTARLQIVDQSAAGWGHVNVDHILQSDTKVKTSMDLVLEKRYLHFPVKTGAQKQRMRLVIDGAVVREFEIELAPENPDFWVFLDVSAFRGKQATLQLDNPTAAPLQAVAVQSDALPDAEKLYREKYRPQFHFTSRRGWLNDPNGLVFDKGEYHLFYQHNPYGWSWGNMHWGHAVSADLVHWRELPIALYPQRFDDWCFSGSAVVDKNNTAGFKTGREDVLVAAYTSTGRGECIAYSNDRGRTWSEYAGNPVVRHSGRDPKLIWHQPTGQWVMAVYDEQGEGENVNKGISFYTSPDLKQWQFQSRIEGYYECPELFPLPVEGHPGQVKWVVYAADGAYSIGAFDGHQFVAESGKHPGHYGNCFYASQTYNNIPPEDGRRIRVGWGTVNLPGMPFNQMMTFPCALSLRETEEGLRLFANPVREIERLHGAHHRWRNEALAPGANLLAGIQGDLFDIRAEFEPGDAERFGFVARGIPITYDVREKKLTCLDRTAPLAPVNGRVRLQLLVDRASIEIFAGDGRVYMPMGVIPNDADRNLAAFSEGGRCTLHALDVYELRSAWE